MGEWHSRDELSILQWGRTFSSAEIPTANLFNAVDHETSMGPHFFKCGNIAAQVFLLSREQLQWGRTFSSAEMSGQPEPSPIKTLLQWGRTFSSAEICALIIRTTSASVLQWGRTFSSAEI